MKAWIEDRFDNLIDCNPAVRATKGEIIENCEMEDIDPNFKYVYPREGKLYKGSNSKFQNGDTVFARITPCLENGKIAQVKGLKNKVGIGSTEYFVFRGKENVTDSDFVYYFTKSNLIRDTAINSMSGASGRQRADIKAIKKLIIKIPNPTLQKKIASILNAYDELIEVNNERIKILEGTARELYKEWFVRMRFPGYKKAKFNKGIPEGWSIQSLHDIADITYGYPFKSELFNESAEGIPLIRIRDLSDGVTRTYTTEVADEKFFALDGDILVGMDGDFHFCKWAGVKAWINQRNVRLRPKDGQGISKYFLYHAVKPQIEFLNEIIVGTTVAHLSATDLRKMKLLVPAKALLKTFKDLSDPIFEQEIVLRKQNTELAAIRDRLLPGLISGRLQVKA